MQNLNLTVRQEEVLKVIQDYVDIHNYAPTVRELCDMLGFSSTSTVHGFIKQIKRKGYIENEKDHPRTIHILKRV